MWDICSDKNYDVVHFVAISVHMYAYPMNKGACNSVHYLVLLNVFDTKEDHHNVKVKIGVVKQSNIDYRKMVLLNLCHYSSLVPWNFILIALLHYSTSM